MFDSIKSFFQNLSNQPGSLDVDKRGEGIDEEVLVSILVMLIEMSSADEHIDEEETQEVVEIVEKHFGAPNELTVRYVERALMEREKIGNLDPFVELLNNTYNEKQKKLLFALFWKITLADEAIDAGEKKLLTQFKARLLLSDEDAEQARGMAESGQV